MKVAFKILSYIIGASGLIEIIIGVFLWSAIFFISGFLSLLHSYAWSYVGDLWEKVEYLERKLS